MGIHGNHSSINLGRGRAWGGLQSLTPGARFKGGEQANFIRQWRTTSILNEEARPTGYYPPATYYPPLTAGGMSARIADGYGNVASGYPAAGFNISASLAGSGNLTNALLGLVVSMIASLSGSGNITSSNLAALGVLAGSLTGSGNLNLPAMGALAFLVVALSGSGDISTAIPAAKGFMSGDINVTGDLLTTVNVGDAVWQTLIEAGYSANEVLKLVSAVLLGESSGQTTAPVFKGLDGATDRVEATVDSSGNRTTVVLDPS